MKELVMDVYHPVGKWVQVFLDGEDITHDCSYANEIDGAVIVFSRNENGLFFVDDKKNIVQEKRYGHVRIDLVSDVPYNIIAQYNKLRE
jgi:hypothetical protein